MAGLDAVIPLHPDAAVRGNSRYWAAAIVLSLCVALTSGATPWLQALAGAFRPPDLAADVAAAQAVAARSHPYTPDFPARHARILGIPDAEGYPYFPHPPFAVALVWPLAGLGFNAIAMTWFVVSLAMLLVLAALLVDIAIAPEASRIGRRVSGGAIGWTFVLLLLWPPVLYNLEKGQLSILLAVLIAFAWRALNRGRYAVAGVCLGAAAAVKTFPILLAGYVLLRARRALKWLIATGATATLAMVAYMGPAAVPAYIQQSSDNVTFWQTWPAVTYSIHGVIARLFIGGRWAEPLTQAPTLAHVVEALLMLVLVTCAARASARSCPKDDEGDRGFAVWTILLVLLNPISMGHNGVLLALPIVLTARALGTDGRTWAKVAWVAGVVLASIPRQTLVSMTATPLDPLRSVFFTALPMWGALSLCAVALATAGNPRSRTSYFEIDNPAIGTSGSPFPASTVSP